MANVRGTKVTPEWGRAPFALRCGAALVDYTVVVALVAGATLMARASAFDGSKSIPVVTTFGYILALAVVFFNFIVFAGFTGYTLGKWVTGLRIVNRHGEPPGLARACLRHLVGYVISFVTFGLGFLVAATHRQGRGLHDLLAGTFVVRDSAVTVRRASSVRRVVPPSPGTYPATATAEMQRDRSALARRVEGKT